MDQTCPLCPDPSKCRGYALMWRMLREGRDVEHWTRLHDRANGITPKRPAAYPPIATQAFNAGKAVMGFVTSGFATVDQDERERRLAICRSCESFDAPRGRCVQCACITRFKALLASEHCPIGKW